MDISRFFSRPRFAAVLSIFIFLLGALAIFQLPTGVLPRRSRHPIVVRAIPRRQPACDFRNSRKFFERSRSTALRKHAVL
jgi:hypothetical protein